MQQARERLYLTADRSRLVREGDPKAAFLYAAAGDEIPASAVEKFGLVNGRLQPARAGKLAALLGSSVLPAMVAIGPDHSVQLGQVVAAAHAASGLSVDAWNALPEPEREGLLTTTILAMRTQPPTTSPKPAPKPKKTAAAKPEKPAGKEQKPADDKEQKAGENKGG